MSQLFTPEILTPEVLGLLLIVGNVGTTVASQNRVWYASNSTTRIFHYNAIENRAEYVSCYANNEFLAINSSEELLDFIQNYF